MKRLLSAAGIASAFLLCSSQQLRAQTVTYADSDCGRPIGDAMGVPVRSNASDTGSPNDCGDRPRSSTQPFPTTSVDGDPFQCPEYIRRFYRVALGIDTSRWSGNAYQYFGNAESFGLRRFENGDAEAPQSGDILIFNPAPGNSAGHVAIVKSVSSTSVTIVEQNWSREVGENSNIKRRPGSSGWTLYRVLNSGAESQYTIRGWIGKRSAAPPPVSGKLTFQLAGVVTNTADRNILAEWVALGYNVFNVSVGDLYQFVYEVDLTAADRDPSVHIGNYAAVLRATLTTPGGAFTWDQSNRIEVGPLYVRDNVPCRTDGNCDYHEGTIQSQFSGRQSTRLFAQFLLEDSDANQFSGDALPTQANLDRYEYRWFALAVFNLPSPIAGTITSWSVLGAP